MGLNNKFIFLFTLTRLVLWRGPLVDCALAFTILKIHDKDNYSGKRSNVFEDARL